jgi:hypothetical protein
MNQYTQMSHSSNLRIRSGQIHTGTIHSRTHYKYKTRYSKIGFDILIFTKTLKTIINKFIIIMEDFLTFA